MNDDDWLNAKVTIPSDDGREFGDDWRSALPPCPCGACADQRDRVVRRPEIPGSRQATLPWEAAFGPGPRRGR